jgi:membrane associated rhomboid family serine protease
MYPLTPWVKRLLIANVLVHVLAKVTGGLAYQWGALVPMEVLSRPWTPVTYMFLHAPGLTHLLFNMLSLFFFGPRLEERLGAGDFLRLYFLGGIGGAVFSYLFDPGSPVVGASAAIFAVLLGFAMYWPRERLYLYAVIPVEAWLLVVGLVAINLFMGIGSMGGGNGRNNVAHFAHLGGAGFGFVFLKWRDWRKGAPRRDFRRRINETPSSTGSDRTALLRWEAIDTRMLHELNRAEVESLLRKAKAGGVRGLTPDERAFLDRMATRH